MNNSNKIAKLGIALNVFNLLILIPALSYLMFMYGFNKLSSDAANYIRPIFMFVWLIGPLVSFAGLIFSLLGMSPKSNREIKFTKYSFIAGIMVASSLLLMAILVQVSFLL